MKSTKQKMKGLKTNFKPDKNQATLTEAFEAGKLIADAKEKRRQALLDLDEIEVKYST